MGAQALSGERSPGFDTVLGHLPLVAWLRYPIKFLNGAVLPVALLSGMGVQSLPGGAKRPAAVLPSSPFPGGLLGIFWTVSAFLAVVTALFLASSGFASWLQRFFFPTSQDRRVRVVAVVMLRHVDRCHG